MLKEKVSKEKHARLEEIQSKLIVRNHRFEALFGGLSLLPPLLLLGPPLFDIENRDKA